MTAQSAVALNLQGTELVVASACDTALGDVSIGESVLGLRRAFVLAGAQTLVISLWKVDDLATAILMEQFYQNLLEKKMGRNWALKAAQYYVRDVKVGELRQTWLRPESMIWQQNKSQKMTEYLQELSTQSNDYQPFVEPKFWAAFIC